MNAEAGRRGAEPCVAGSACDLERGARRVLGSPTAAPHATAKAREEVAQATATAPGSEHVGAVVPVPRG